MDNDALNAVVRDADTRQFWVKQWGVTDEPEPLHESVRKGSQFWARPEHEITLAKSKNPPSITERDILLIHLIKQPYTEGPRLVCIAEVLSTPSFVTNEQLRKEPVRARWPWSVNVRNLTREYSSKWFNYSLNPYELTKEFIKLHPADTVTRTGTTLNTLRYGKTIVRVQEGFAKFVIDEVLVLR